jgi:prephenate dehydratase
MRIAYLGPEGTFSEEAALLQAARDGGATLVPFSTFPALVLAVETGLADRAILPIENSLEGAISTTVDLLIDETKLKIHDELVLTIRHNLIVVPGTQLSDICYVVSKPEVFGQCRRFLDRCLPAVQQIAALSSAAAVADVMASGDRSRAAIGTVRAAELNDAEILARDIQDNDSNVTRFVVLGWEDSAPTGHDKTSLCFTVRRNVPGALCDVLNDLSAAHIQMTKVESRPMKSVLGDYYFLVDIEGHRSDTLIAETLKRITEKTSLLKIFGSYPRHDISRAGVRIPRE